MNNFDNPRTSRHNQSSRIWLGLILFLAGLALFAYKLGMPLPSWLFTWPMILILIGLFLGVKDRFQNPGSWIMLLIGAIFLADQSMVGLNFRRYITPLILIIIGMAFILRPKTRQQHSMPPGDGKPSNQPDDEEATTALPSAANQNATDYEVVNINSLFGGVKKLVLSKNFQGGTITTFMGGAELNLLQADIHQPIILEVNNVFGGTKLILPANWDIKNEVTAIFGGVEDKRNFNSLSPDPGKTVLIRGTCLFGGIEFSSY